MGKIIELADYKDNIRPCCRTCFHKGNDNSFGLSICKCTESKNYSEVVMDDAVCPKYLRK